MYRKVLALIIVAIVILYIGYSIQDHTKEVIIDRPTITFTPVTDTPLEPDTNISDTTYDFISFASEHVLDIEPILQMPEYPTGCELVSLTMALSYITGEKVDTDILIDDYLTFTANDFIKGFMGNPKSENGGGCFPPVIVKCANEYLSDCHISLVATDATGITRQEIYDTIDEGFPILMWSTMYMGEPTKKNHIITVDDKTYQWYVSEHCLVIKGYNLEKDVFIINDPLIGEVERDIDEFMEISDAIGNLAVIIK